MANKIKIQLGAKTIELNSDIPDFSELVQQIVINKDINFDELSVTCEDDEKFDSESFRQSIISVIKDTKDKLKLNEQNYKEALKNLPNFEKDCLDQVSKKATEE